MNGGESTLPPICGDAPMCGDVRRIVVLRANGVGDFIFALPAIAALRTTYPQAQIIFLGKAWHASFLHERPCGIDEVIAVPPVHGLTAASADAECPATNAQFFARMRAYRFDLALQMHGGGRYANPFVRQLGARLTFGARTADAAPLDRWVLYQPLQNERMRLLEVANLAGARTDRLEPRLPLTPRDFRELAEHWQPDDSPLVVMQPGATDQRRYWPAEKFAAVADALAAEGALIAVNGIESERQVTAQLVAAMRTAAIDLTGALSLSALAALISKARLVVGNDSGPLHLAQALGTPTVGVYWFTNLLRSAPLAWRSSRCAVAVRTQCPVCGCENVHARCAHDVSFVSEVPVDEVIALALELYRDGQRD